MSRLIVLFKNPAITHKVLILTGFVGIFRMQKRKTNYNIIENAHIQLLSVVQ